MIFLLGSRNTSIKYNEHNFTIGLPTYFHALILVSFFLFAVDVTWSVLAAGSLILHSGNVGGMKYNSLRVVACHIKIGQRFERDRKSGCAIQNQTELYDIVCNGWQNV